MKNILKTTILLVAALMFATGCIKEAIPAGSTQTEGQISGQTNSLVGMLNSIPAAMVNTNTTGYAEDYHFDFGIGAIHLATENMLEDLVTLGSNPGYNWFNRWTRCVAQGEDYISAAYFWLCYYPWIKSCNDIIGIVDSNPATADAQLYLGQAYAYRANFYLDMARLYLPKENKYIPIPDAIKGLTVPIITENTTEEDAIDNPRAPRKEMYEFILSDLANAERLLKGKSVDYTAPGLAVVYGLYARAYLEMGAEGDEGAYNKAYEYADLAITTSGKTPLTKSEWQDPVNGFNNGGANNSWMWGVVCTKENFNNLITYAAHICVEGTWGYGPLAMPGINKATYERINAFDFRRGSWLDANGEAQAPLSGTAAEQKAFLDAGKPYVSIKFHPAQGNCNNYTVGNAVDIMLMRIEEMWFIKMEALVKTGQLGEAKDLLKQFMDKRVLNRTYSTDKLTSEEEFIDEMLFQKRVEFWGEGILIYDYKRLDKGITRGYPGTNHPAIMAFNCEGRSPQWTIVLPKSEVQSNNAINSETNNPDPSSFVPLWTGSN